METKTLEPTILDKISILVNSKDKSNVSLVKHIVKQYLKK